MPQTQTRDRRRSARGFSLVELLVAISIISILASLGVFVSRTVIEQQRRGVTLNTMRTINLALDQFTEEDPFRAIYGRRGQRSFGALPPYAIVNSDSDSALNDDDHVLSIFARDREGLDRGRPRWRDEAWSFETLIARDFGLQAERDLDITDAGAEYRLGNSDADLELRLAYESDNAQQLVTRTPSLALQLGTGSLGSTRDEFERLLRLQNDNRALYLYLAVGVPGLIDQIPPEQIRPMTLDAPVTPPISAPSGAFAGDYIVIGGVSSSSRGNQTAIRTPIRGFVDGWGVPLEYALNARIEWGVRADGEPDWIVTERQPQLRSAGRPLEDLRGGLAPEWIDSAPLPGPRMFVEEAPTSGYSGANDGIVDEGGAGSKLAAGGWSRIVPEGHRYTAEDWGNNDRGRLEALGVPPSTWSVSAFIDIDPRRLD